MKPLYPWHEPLLQRLQALGDADQLPNAIALTSPPGWGHENLLAHAALTLLGILGERQIDEFAHPDFRWIVPDGAVIKIDQVRRLNDFAVQTPQMAPRKVAAVLDAHLLNANAANALLKTLEEPPPNTHLLLATPFWGKLLPTIRSRCQRFQVSADNTLARQWLDAQGFEVSDATYAEFGYAPEAVAQGLSEAQIEITPWLVSLSKTPLESSVAPVLEQDAVLWLSRWYRRLLLHLRGDAIPNCQIAASALIGFADGLLSIRRQIETSNSANTRLLLEHLVVRWVQLLRQNAT